MAKLSDSIEVYLDDETAAAFKARAAKAGCSASELLRDLVCDLIHDMTYGEFVAKSRRAALQRVPPKRRQGDGE